MKSMLTHVFCTPTHVSARVPELMSMEDADRKMLVIS
jgi:hypothetical protein